MQIPTEIVFEGMDSSDAVETRIHAEIDKLERFHERMTACRVVVSAPPRPPHKGGLFNVRIHITVPGGAEVAATRSPSKRHAHEDVYVAIRDAFAAARRQLQDETRRMQGKVKQHETPPHGRVVRCFPEQGYGFIESADGREIYFHRNSLVNASIEQLEVGQEVRFAEEVGDKGAQASTVHLVGKHHPV